MAGSRAGFLQDHIVLSRVLFPAAAFVEVSLAAALIGVGQSRGPPAQLGLSNIAISSPLILRKLGDSRDGTVRVLCTADPRTGSVTVQSQSGGAAVWQRHTTGCVTAVWCGACSGGETAPAEKCGSVRTVVGTVSCEGASDFYINPAALDAVLQLGAAPRGCHDPRTMVPAGLRAYGISARPAG